VIVHLLCFGLVGRIVLDRSGNRKQRCSNPELLRSLHGGVPSLVGSVGGGRVLQAKRQHPVKTDARI